MTKLLRIAIFFVATYAFCTGASAQNVYKCGSVYSQKPCPNAVELDVQDARTPAQKAEADAKTRREMAQANAMEKTRLKEEAQARAAQAKLAAAERKKAATPKPRNATSDADTAQAATPKGKSKAKKPHSAKLQKDPAVFVAKAPEGTGKPNPAAGKGK